MNKEELNIPSDERQYSLNFIRKNNAFFISEDSEKVTAGYTEKTPESALESIRTYHGKKIEFIKVEQSKLAYWIGKKDGLNDDEKIIPEGEAKSRHVYPGDFLLTNSMSFGRAFITRIDGYIHDGWLRLRPNKELLDKEYLYYFLTSSLAQNQLKAVATGSVVNNLKSDTVKAVWIDLPQLEVQKAIAKTLSVFDEKIVANNEINKNLQQQAQAIYSHMMIENSDVSWTSGNLSDIALITMGQSPKGDTYNEDGIGTVFFQGRAEFGFRFPTRRLYTTDPKRMAQANDALMSVRAPVGDMNVAYEDCCIGRGLSAIRSKDNHQSFVLYTMLNLREQLNVFNGEGTVFGSINKDALNSMPIRIPPVDIIDQFEEVVSPMDRAIRCNYEEICRLTDVRDSLLPRLMSGELDVSELEL